MESFGLTPLDIVAFGVLIFAGLMGLSSGLVHAVLFIGAWVGAGVAAWQLTPVLQPEVEKFVSGPQVAYFATLLGVFVLALMAFTMIAGTIGKFVRGSALKTPDKILGLGFGAGCGVLVLSTAFLLYTYIVRPDPLPRIVSEAMTFPIVREGAALIEPRLPESFKTRARSISVKPQAPATPGAGEPGAPPAGAGPAVAPPAGAPPALATPPAGAPNPAGTTPR
ncbi:MAG: CvpA family protein [Rhodospirillales bacterium]|nr:MAG: CvpA family protein [Rhodospirillales bacterium]